MVDNYLERRYAEYEKKKQEYLRKKKRLPKTNLTMPERPDDEAL